MLLRTYVSQNAASKGRAVLEGVGLSSEAIEMCYTNWPRNEEEAVQSGLFRWRAGEGASPTWAVLLEAMHYAKINVQHISALEDEVLKGTVLSSWWTECTNSLALCPFHCDQLFYGPVP